MWTQLPFPEFLSSWFRASFELRVSDKIASICCLKRLFFLLRRGSCPSSLDLLSSKIFEEHGVFSLNLGQWWIFFGKWRVGGAHCYKAHKIFCFPFPSSYESVTKRGQFFLWPCTQWIVVYGAICCRLPKKLLWENCGWRTTWFDEGRREKSDHDGPWSQSSHRQTAPGSRGWGRWHKYCSFHDVTLFWLKG